MTQDGHQGQTEPNAAVVGVLLAALYNPVFTTAVRDARDLAAALVGFGMLQLWKLPRWIIVLFMGTTGQLIPR